MDAPEALRGELDRFFTDERLVALASAAERVTIPPGAGRCHVQLVTQVSEEVDDQSHVHVDTFHPTHKVWLYLTDVEPDDGTLTYYPRSHRLSVAGLSGVYRDSIHPVAEASRRVPPREIARRGLDPRHFTARANTMVMADTSGYHARRQGRPGGSRLALHMEFRPDPFIRDEPMVLDHPTAVSDEPSPRSNDPTVWRDRVRR
ncbi:MAG: hypothetical protein R2698_00815 [Microthrixaceae bacterium]